MLTKNLVVVAMAGLGLYTIMSALAPRTASQGMTGRRSTHDGSEVRPAGPKAMKDRPKEWDMVDERADESFPASDPPGTY